MENRNWVNVLFVVDILRLRSYKDRGENNMGNDNLCFAAHKLYHMQINRVSLGENIDAQIHKK